MKDPQYRKFREIRERAKIFRDRGIGMEVKAKRDFHLGFNDGNGSK